MFEKVQEIFNKIEENNKFISNYTEKLKQLSKGGHFIEEHNESVYMGKEANVRKIENKILYDNARVAAFEEVIPKALEIWNKYVGKPYGKKTEEKIRNEIKDATGCWFYCTDKEYGCDEFSFCIDYRTYPNIGYSFTATNNFEICPINYEQKFLDGNKIQHVNFDEIKLSYCNEYVADTHDEAKQIADEIHECQKAFDALEQRVHELNYRLPSKCETVNLGYPRWWNIA